MGRVQDKVAIITGGAAGIGAATARRLIEEGARVTITDIADDIGATTASELGCDFLSQDVTDEAQWNNIVDHVTRKHGGLHILLNGAGIEGDLTQSTPENTSYDEWKRVHRVNLDGVFLGCRAAIPAMRAAGGGSIINISSIVAYFATANSAAYGASKAAVMQLTKSVAYHCAKGPARVRCNSIHPGQIRTRMIESIYSFTSRRNNISLEDAQALMLARVPYGELGEPEDVANLILFLASDESSYITGSEFQVDGGWNLT